jgi:large subunit ribosomal protein L30
MAKKKSSKGKGALRVKLVKSVIGSTEYQRAVIRGLGLRKLQSSAELQDTKEIRGMIGKVAHLVEVLES